MDKQFTFQFTKALRIIVDPILLALKYTIKGVSTAFTRKVLILKKGVTGQGTIIGDNLPDTVEITTTVIPTEHHHAPATLPASVSAVKNTLALRNANGYAYSRASSTSDTGYKISTGADIASLFQTINDPYMTVEHRTSGSGSIITNAWLSKENNKLIINTTKADYCQYWEWCRCKCCD